MSNEIKPDDIQLKFYAMLVDQLQKYTTILWQFPTALLAANFFALDKFLSQPEILLTLSVVDGVLIYAFHRLVLQQRAIIAATKRVEESFKQTNYASFIPTFSVTRVRAPSLIAWTLWALALGIAVYSLVRLFGIT